MQLSPSAAYVIGALSFRDSLNIESTDTFTIEAETNYHLKFFTFQFEKYNVRYNYKEHKLSHYQRTEVAAGSILDNYSMTLSYFFEQQIEIDQIKVNLLSFVFDISEGDEYRIFKVHGYFSTDFPKIIIKDKQFLAPYA